MNSKTKRLFQILGTALAIGLMSSCVVTAPIKASKIAVKTSAKTVKTATKAGAMVIPSGKDKKSKKKKASDD